MSNGSVIIFHFTLIDLGFVPHTSRSRTDVLPLVLYGRYQKLWDKLILVGKAPYLIDGNK